MSKPRFESLLSVKLIALAVCLLMAGRVSSQERLPQLIVVEQDTLVTVTERQFDIILFSMSYIRSLENTNNITSEELLRQKQVNDYLQDVLTLERAKTAHKDSIIVNLEDVIKQHEKKAKRERLKQSLIYIFGGAVIAAETGLLFYQLLK